MIDGATFLPPVLYQAEGLFISPGKINNDQAHLPLIICTFSYLYVPFLFSQQMF